MCLRCQRVDCQSAEKVGRPVWLSTVGSSNRFAFPFPNSYWQVMVGNCIDNIKMQSKMTFPVAMRCFYYPHSPQIPKAWSVMYAFAIMS